MIENLCTPKTFPVKTSACNQHQHGSLSGILYAIVAGWVWDYSITKI